MVKLLPDTVYRGKIVFAEKVQLPFWNHSAVFYTRSVIVGNLKKPISLLISTKKKKKN